MAIVTSPCTKNKPLPALPLPMATSPAVTQASMQQSIEEQDPTIAVMAGAPEWTSNGSDALFCLASCSGIDSQLATHARSYETQVLITNDISPLGYPRENSPPGAQDSRQDPLSGAQDLRKNSPPGAQDSRENSPGIGRYRFRWPDAKNSTTLYNAPPGSPPQSPQVSTTRPRPYHLASSWWGNSEHTSKVSCERRKSVPPEQTADWDHTRMVS